MQILASRQSKVAKMKLLDLKILFKFNFLYSVLLELESFSSKDRIESLETFLKVNCYQILEYLSSKALIQDGHVHGCG